MFDKTMDFYRPDKYGMQCPICSKIIVDGEPILKIHIDDNDDTPIYLIVCFNCGVKPNIKPLIEAVE